MQRKKRTFYAIDLFAGCGGLSEGFRQAGFEIIAQVEVDKWACETLITRHLYHELRKIGKINIYNRYLKGDIKREEIFFKFPEIESAIRHRVIRIPLGKERNDEIIERIKLSMKVHRASKIHVVIGGPPCQPYSLIGRARDPLKMREDDRHALYKEYLELIRILQPDFFVYENVPGLLTAKNRGEAVFDRMLKDFFSIEPAYEIALPRSTAHSRLRNPFAAHIINSADFFVPQIRKRLFLIGYRKSLLKKDPDIKSIFHRLQRLALRNREKGYLTVRDAIGDLPPLKQGEGDDEWYGPYNNDTQLSRYQKEMRRRSPGILNHRARTHMESDLRRYKFFIRYCENYDGTPTLNDLKREKRDLLPRHRNLKDFIDRFKVQRWNRPASTITAHISRDGHYYIHPDIHQCRSFTVREAARCQSFPDNFKFEGPRTEQFKQVGNAVPPRVAKVIADQIIMELKKIYGSE